MRRIGHVGLIPSRATWTGGVDDPLRAAVWAAYREAVGEESWASLQRYDDALHPYEPVRPYWYLGVLATHPDAEQPLIDGGRTYGERDGQLTFDKLSSVFASGNRTRDDQPNHLLVRTRVAPDVAELWANLCPAQVYTDRKSVV